MVLVCFGYVEVDCIAFARWYCSFPGCCLSKVSVRYPEIWQNIWWGQWSLQQASQILFETKSWKKQTFSFSICFFFFCDASVRIVHLVVGFSRTWRNAWSSSWRKKRHRGPGAFTFRIRWTSCGLSQVRSIRVRSPDFCSGGWHEKCAEWCAVRVAQRVAMIVT